MYKSARCTKAAVIPHRTKVMHIYIKTSLFTKHFSVTNLFHLTDSSDTGKCTVFITCVKNESLSR